MMSNLPYKILKLPFILPCQNSGWFIGKQHQQALGKRYSTVVGFKFLLNNVKAHWCAFSKSQSILLHKVERRFSSGLFVSQVIEMKRYTVTKE